MDKLWLINKPGEKDKVLSLSNTLNINYLCANLLLQRGITNQDEAALFFNPKLSALHDPYLMKDMQLAVDRIISAIENNEKILVYGDYDVDGITAVAMVYSFLSKRYNNLGYYVPDRYTEGYGISNFSIEYAKENDFKLIIALDCGIKAGEKILKAKQFNIDFIICDHHTTSEYVPDASAVLDPKRVDCQYPYKELSGCGVGYKLLQALIKTPMFATEEVEKELQDYLDLVCVSTAADIVPLTGENRILVYHGLKKLNENPSLGFKAMKKMSGITKPMVINDVVFKLGPRINAAGRIGVVKEAVELLITDNEELAVTKCGIINTFNETRQKLDMDITQEAFKRLSEQDKLQPKKATVLYNSKWSKGVLGIVASRLLETYYRPTVILTDSNGLISGSARSVEGYNLYHALEMCSDLFDSFGGHMYAAGLTMRKENLQAFSERFEEVVSNSIQPHHLVPTIHCDMETDFSTIITKDFFEQLRAFAPFGPENSAPVFITRNVYDYGTSRVVGPKSEHLKMELIDNSKTIVQCIGFYLAAHIDKIKSGKPFDICYTIEENEYMDKTYIQLQVKDIKYSTPYN